VSESGEQARYEAAADGLKRVERKLDRVLEVLLDPDTGLAVRVARHEERHTTLAKEHEETKAELAKTKVVLEAQAKVQAKVEHALGLLKKLGAGATAVLTTLNLPQLAELVKGWLAP
jgi:NADH dehydrogenase/NADH:ubiquinone oxidoreductase subunit G